MWTSRKSLKINFNEYKSDWFEIAIPKIITQIAKDKGYNPPKESETIFFDDVAVYPTEVFYPKKSSWAEAVITKNTYTIHHYEGSWRTPKQIFRSKMKKKIINIIRTLQGKEKV